MPRPQRTPARVRVYVPLDRSEETDADGRLIPHSRLPDESRTMLLTRADWDAMSPAQQAEHGGAILEELAAGEGPQ